jgi:hypothetical protein
MILISLNIDSKKCMVLNRLKTGDPSFESRLYIDVDLSSLRVDVSLCSYRCCNRKTQ